MYLPNKIFSCFSNAVVCRFQIGGGGRFEEDFRSRRDQRSDTAKDKGDCRGLLGQEVSDAVITVPTYFNDAQRRATRVRLGEFVS